MGLDQFYKLISTQNNVISCASHHTPLPPKQNCRTGKTVIVEDCMCRLTSLHVVGANRSPLEYLRAFCGPYIDEHSRMGTKLNLIHVLFDKTEFITDLKKAVQSQRNLHRNKSIPNKWTKLIPEDNVQEYEFRDDGLWNVKDNIRHSSDMNLRMCMLYRYLRPLVFRYFSKHIHNYMVKHGFGGRVLCSLDDRAAHNIGEGELRACSVALKYRKTHSIQLWSGDSDILALGFWFTPLFTHTVWIRLKPNVWYLGTDLLRIVPEFKWTSHTLLWAIIMNGTDFVKRSNMWCRMNRLKTLDTIRFYFTNHVTPQDSCPWADLGAAKRFAFYILGIRFGRPKIDPPVSWKELCLLEQRYRKKSKKYYLTPLFFKTLTAQLELGIQNMRYWVTLQNSLPIPPGFYSSDENWAHIPKRPIGINSLWEKQYSEIFE
jgi:hypothetical protein